MSDKVRIEIDKGAIRDCILKGEGTVKVLEDKANEARDFMSKYGDGVVSTDTYVGKKRANVRVNVHSHHMRGAILKHNLVEKALASIKE